MPKLRARNKGIKHLWYFVQWKGYVQDANTWEPPESMKKAVEEVERLHSENLEVPGPGEVE